MSIQEPHVILVTGGAGYIGSHSSIELLNCGYDIVIVDNLSNSTIDVLDSIRKISGLSYESERIKFYNIELLDVSNLEIVFSENNISCVFHLAGLKSLTESVKNPLNYYKNNVSCTIALLDTMKKFNVKRMVISSSAMIYGEPKELPIKETHSLNPTNVYSKTKLMIEQILHDIYESDKSWSFGILRYFNPAGAHPSGLLGEDITKAINLFPCLSRVALQMQEYLPLHGTDHPTKDGTAIRDYIHIVDIAQGHLLILKKVYTKGGILIYNLGSEKGATVLEIIREFEKISCTKIATKVVERRIGDISISVSDSSLAFKELGWRPTKTLQDVCSFLTQGIHG